MRGKCICNAFVSMKTKFTVNGINVNTYTCRCNIRKVNCNISDINKKKWYEILTFIKSILRIASKSNKVFYWSKFFQLKIFTTSNNFHSGITCPWHCARLRYHWRYHSFALSHRYHVNQHPQLHNISMALCNTVVSPLLMRWRCLSLALSHKYLAC